MEQLRPELEELPARLKALPVHRGYPVPWFVGWIGESGFAVEPLSPGSVPEFRVADERKWPIAVRQKRCWVCGEPLGRMMTFVLGPMCGINRTSAEPPCHLECARWSARNCPFLSKPQMVRRETPLPEHSREMAGFAILRNPGVTLLWTTRSYEIFDDGRGRALIEIGEPEAWEWWALGKPATRRQVVASVESGIGALEELARGEKGALEDLARRKAELMKRYPPATDVRTPEFEAAFLRDSKEICKDPVKVEMDMGLAMVLIAQVQLALRHPKNRGPAAELAQEFVDGLIDRVATTEVLREGLEAGFDEQWDVVRAAANAN